MHWPTDIQAQIARTASLIDGAHALIVAAGAGMGVDSGLPDFRGTEGFWNAYPALGRAQIDFGSIASPDMFRINPRLAWGFYGQRLALYRRTLPHAGFTLLKLWGETMLHEYAVFTSNVDGQFTKAGFDERTIHECHGSIHHFQCLESCTFETWSADGFEPEVDEASCTLLNAPPICRHCGGGARPNVMMFGDFAWSDRRERFQSARMDEWLSGIDRPVVIELGAGAAIPSVRQFSHRVIQQYDGRLVRINPGDCSVPSDMHVAIPMGALQGLTAIEAALGSMC